MKYFIILIVLFSISCNVQEKDISYDKLIERNGIMFEAGGSKPYSGKFHSNYDNHKIKIIGYFNNGKKSKQWKYFYPNGNILKIENYKNGLLEGNYKEYNDQKVLIKDINYSNGKKNGHFVFYYANGNKKKEGNFINDNLTGIITKWYKNKFKFFEGNYPDGLHIWFNKDGKKGATIEFKNNKMIKKTLKFWWKDKAINPYTFINKNWIVKEGKSYGGTYRSVTARDWVTPTYRYVIYYYFSNNNKFIIKSSRPGSTLHKSQYHNNGTWWIDTSRLPNFVIATKIIHNSNIERKSFLITAISKNSITANGKKWTKL